MVKRLLVISALVLAGFAGSASVSSAKVPGPVLGTQDVCACGGQITYRFYARYPSGAFADCWYEGRAPNGTVVNYIVDRVTQFQACPSSP